jgi:hypothetical protein
MIDEILVRLLSSLGGGLIVFIVIISILIRNPEKVDKWLALLLRLLNRLGYIFKFAHRQYVKHDLQGRVNEFAKELTQDAPFIASTRIRVELAEGSITRKSFLEKGEVILRLRREDPDELNFVHGAYMFVSTSLLFKIKRYISPSQRECVDLFVTTNLLKKEKPSVVDYFLDEYLHPKTADTDSKIAQYFDKFAKIDQGGMFYPLLLQELYFLGNKVFGDRKDEIIIIEVNSLTDFLEQIASRKVGDESNLEFEGKYCRFAIIIVGKSFKLTPTGDVYTKFARKKIIPRNIETIYFLCLWENKDILDKICEELSEVYEKCRIKKSNILLKYGDKLVKREQCLVVLRKKNIDIFQPSD